jgi:hypothetical protein
MPDLICARNGVFVGFLEVKMPKARNRLSPAQLKFHEAFRHSVSVVTNIDEALRAIGL